MPASDAPVCRRHRSAAQRAVGSTLVAVATLHRSSELRRGVRCQSLSVVAVVARLNSLLGVVEGRVGE
jgi:hypothetical protein